MANFRKVPVVMDLTQFEGHKKGPWRLTDNTSCWTISTDEALVFWLTTGTTSPATSVDANLIASAPELLAYAMELEERVNKLQQVNKVMLDVLKRLRESASYWCDYDVPVGIVERINNAITMTEDN
jgi:hypothetical protein